MPTLTNSRQEQFAALVAIGKTPAEAYAAVGYKPKTAYTCGPRLMKRPRVRARVTELQQAVTETAVARAAVDRENVLAELLNIARNGESESARIRAYELVGKELGMFTGRSEQSRAPIQNIDLSQYTLEELEFFEGVHKRLQMQHESEPSKPANSAL